MPEIPRFGVPDKIDSRSVIFVVAAGIPLTIAYIGAAAAVMSQFGIKPDDDNGILGTIFLGAVGLGPASAYFFGS